MSTPFDPVEYVQVSNGWQVRILHAQGGYVPIVTFYSEEMARERASHISSAIRSWQP